MKRISGALAIVAVLAAASPALASRAPSGAEKRAITSAVRANLIKSGSPAAKTAVINGIKISTKNGSWAVADVSAPEADDAVVALRRVGRTWKVKNLGTAQVQCGIGMPKAVQQELFRSTNCRS
jgi:hypothetical protein